MAIYNANYIRNEEVELVKDGETIYCGNAENMPSTELAAEDFKEKSAGDRRKLIKILLVMYYAHASSKLKESAREILSSVF